MDIRTPIPNNGGDWQGKFGELWKGQIEAVKARFGAAIEEVRSPVESPTDVPIIYVKREQLIQVLQFLKQEPSCDYQFLADLTATDEEVEPRFEVVYNLFSLSKKSRIRVKARAKDGESVPTATLLWPAANWAEREVWDMYGVRFEGHPDLRRILMDERWVGHPLRKDYPLRGYQVFTEPMPIRPELLD
ncbi:NADH-quinone oxidoreductase subunit C [Bdellovibrionota bacterium FG-1]